MQYLSQDTGELVTIECRFCRKFDDKHQPAIRLEGQWQGGDEDVDPHWVPVCEGHATDWHVTHKSGPSADALDDWMEIIPEPSRLPSFSLLVPRESLADAIFKEARHG